jgi:hypothetical protein
MSSPLGTSRHISFRRGPLVPGLKERVACSKAIRVASPRIGPEGVVCSEEIIAGLCRQSSTTWPLTTQKLTGCETNIASIDVYSQHSSLLSPSNRELWLEQRSGRPEAGSVCRFTTFVCCLTKGLEVFAARPSSGLRLKVDNGKR